jgi:hypothetical protein
VTPATPPREEFSGVALRPRLDMVQVVHFNIDMHELVESNGH